ncbi:hypothetical protein ABZP36_034192 [Zizania latifolia]
MTTLESSTNSADEGLLLLPPQIQVLRIWDCDEMNLGLHGPLSLQKLVISNCPKLLCSGSSFPTSLQKLTLIEVNGLETLQWPIPNLTQLHIESCGDLKDEVLWPLLAQGHLTHLVVRGTHNFFLASEPSRVDEQDIHRSSRLQELRTDDFAGVLAAPICHVLSSSLTYLCLEENDEVECFTKQQEEALQNLTSIQKLSIRDCEKLQSLPAAGISRSLQCLYISNCPAISSLGSLPHSLQQLKIFDCPTISSLVSLPDSLQQLEISDCLAISLLGSLPHSLQQLDIYNCPAISSLGSLPDSLQHLQISHCQAISSLGSLPDSLQHLGIYNCRAINSLGSLPDSLQQLDIYSDNDVLKRQCHKLQGTIPIICT